MATKQQESAANRYAGAVSRKKQFLARRFKGEKRRAVKGAKFARYHKHKAMHVGHAVKHVGHGVSFIGYLVIIAVIAIAFYLVASRYGWFGW